jgi:hypothetical protein
MKHLGRPQRNDDVQLARPPADAESLGDRRRQIGALRVERPSCLLEIGEPRPVLEMEECAAFEIPCGKVRSSSELKVLVRLIYPDAIPEPAEMRSLTADMPTSL